MAKQISVLSTSCTMEIRGLCRLLNIFTTCLLNCLFSQIVPYNTENLLYVLQTVCSPHPGWNPGSTKASDQKPLDFSRAVVSPTDLSLWAQNYLPCDDQLGAAPSSSADVRGCHHRNWRRKEIGVCSFPKAQPWGQPCLVPLWLIWASGSSQLALIWVGVWIWAGWIRGLNKVKCRVLFLGHKPQTT